VQAHVAGFRLAVSCIALKGDARGISI